MNRPTQTYQFEPIGFIESPYPEKFGVPRQPGLVPSAKGRIVITPPYNNPKAVEGLEQSSHLWILFVFHCTADRGWQPSVRPPRLGGNRRMGVFATRSGFRPNPIGMSVVELEGVSISDERIEIKVSGLDLVDGTPVLDVKPYIPYSDQVPDACSELAPQAPELRLSVQFSQQAENALSLMDDEMLRRLIVETLSLDPRPAYKRSADDKEYAMRLQGVDVKWRVMPNDCVRVEDIVQVSV